MTMPHVNLGNPVKRRAMTFLVVLAAATAAGCQAAGAGRSVEQGGGIAFGDVGPAAKVRVYNDGDDPLRAAGLVFGGGLAGAAATLLIQIVVQRLKNRTAK